MIIAKSYPTRTRGIHKAVWKPYRASSQRFPSPDALFEDTLALTSGRALIPVPEKCQHQLTIVSS